MGYLVLWGLAVFVAGGREAAANGKSLYISMSETQSGALFDHPFYKIPIASQKHCENVLNDSQKSILLLVGTLASDPSRMALVANACWAALTSDGLREAPPRAVSLDDYRFPDPRDEREALIIDKLILLRRRYILFPKHKSPVSIRLYPNQMEFQGKPLIGHSMAITYSDGSVDLEKDVLDPKLDPKFLRFVGQKIDLRPFLNAYIDKKFFPPEIRDDTKYLEKKILSLYSAYRKKKSGPEASTGKFCAEFATGQKRDQEFAKHYGVRRFLTAEEWRFATEYGLTEGEMMAIQVFLAEGSYSVNSALRGSTVFTEELKILDDTMRHGMLRLPSHVGKIYRRTRLPENVLSEHQAGKTVVYRAYSSTSARKGWLEEGLYQGHALTIHAHDKAKDVAPISLYAEDEVILLPGVRLKVESRAPDPKHPGLFQFELTETR